MRRSNDFDAAVRRGSRAGRQTLVVHLTRTPTEDPARVGFVVSRAVGSAVVRNRVKRRLRHLTRERLDRLPAGSLAVVRANQAAAARSAEELARALDGALATALRRTGRAGDPAGSPS
jgi:ribonuclease P protein component